ncbi:MAG: acyl-CoA thioesterase, partial [Xanthomonadales bacterium]|nr:acyl-CoA thioesterase [Xanthomonadales bacterium]
MSPDAWPVVILRHVKWGEMDAFGHVNNTVYFRYFEDVRIAHFDALGVMRVMEEQGLGPILASTRARFKAALTYPDEVEIRSRIRDLENDRFRMEYAVFSLGLERVACEGEGLI